MNVILPIHGGPTPAIVNLYPSLIAIQSPFKFFHIHYQSLSHFCTIFTVQLLFYAYIAIILYDHNTIITMDTLDIILNGLRYAPLCLMGMGVMMLLWIQVKELKKF